MAPNCRPGCVTCCLSSNRRRSRIATTAQTPDWLCRRWSRQSAVAGLAFHLAAVGLIGLMVIVLLAAFNGVIEEHQLGHAFEGPPFTALLVVFFAIVAVIHDQHLFTPVADAVLAMESGYAPPCSFWPTACCR